MSGLSIALGETAVLPTLPSARRGKGPDYAKRPMLVF